MPTQYEIDTKLVELLLGICFVLSIFSFVFLRAISPAGILIAPLQSMYILFVMLFTLFLAFVFMLFIKWYSKYKASLFKFS